MSHYELDRLRLHAKLVARFARARDVSADVLLGLKLTRPDAKPPKLAKRVQRRIEEIQHLSPHLQRSLLNTSDTFLKGRRAS